MATSATPKRKLNFNKKPEEDAVVPPPKKKLATAPLKKTTVAPTILKKKKVVVVEESDEEHNIESERNEEEYSPEEATQPSEYYGEEEEEEETGDIDPEDPETNGEETAEDDENEEEEDKEDKNTEPVRADFEDFIVAKQIKISVCQTEDRIIGYPTTGNKNIYFEIFDNTIERYRKFYRKKIYTYPLGVIIQLESDEYLEVQLADLPGIVLDKNHYPPMMTTPMIRFTFFDDVFLPQNKPLFRACVNKFQPIIPVFEKYEILQKEIAEKYHLLHDTNNIFQIDSVE
jgi:hypothetical protein